MADERIFEYVERDQLERLLREFAEVADVATRLSDPDGNTLLGPFNYRDLCRNFNCKYRPELCIASTKKKLEELGAGEYLVYSCAGDGDDPGVTGPGIIDAVVPIRVVGEHLATISCGQVLYSKLTRKRRAKFRAYAKRTLKLSGDELEAYVAAVGSLKTMQETRFRMIVNALTWIANLVSRYAYDHSQAKQLYPLVQVKQRTPDQIVAEVLATVGSIIKGTLGIALWYCDGQGMLVLKALWNLDPQHVSRRVLRMDHSVSGRAIREGEALFVNPYEDEAFEDKVLLAKYGDCRLLAIPLVDLTGHNRHLGALAVFLPPDTVQPRDEVTALAKQTRGPLESALHRESRLHLEGIITLAADLLHAPEESAWEAFDRRIRATLPNLAAYVLYKRKQEGAPLLPDRTQIFPDTCKLEEAGLRKFCRSVLKELGPDGALTVCHDVLSDEAPPQFRGLFERARRGSASEPRGFTVVGASLLDANHGVLGALVCVGARTCLAATEHNAVVFATFSQSHLSTLMGISSVLSIVLISRETESARASALTIRAHELVAPLQAIKGYHDNLSVLFTKEIRPALGPHGAHINAFGVQLARLGELCDFLELIATGTAFEEESASVLCSFEHEVLRIVIPPLRAYALMDKNTSVYYSKSLETLPPLYIAVDPMKRCVFNLVHNGIKYCRDNTELRITLDTSPEHYSISVANEGIGVPAGETDMIFQRFKQGSNAHRAVAYGAGLGLFIARAIARWHGGDVEVLDQSPESTVFVLRLPRTLERIQPAASV